MFFPPSARVRSRADYARVFEHGRRTAEPLLSLHWLRGDSPARLGLAVSRKVDPRAVVRNRIKRVLRDQFRHMRARLAPGDYVIVARAPAATASSADLREALLRLWQRAGALPRPAMPGTMID